MKFVSSIFKSTFMLLYKWQLGCINIYLNFNLSTSFWHLEKTILLLLRSPLYIVYCIYIISELTRFKFANWECRLIILGKSKTETKVIIYSVDNFLNTEKWGESFVTVYSYQELHVLTIEITRNIIFNSSQVVNEGFTQFDGNSIKSTS